MTVQSEGRNYGGLLIEEEKMDDKSSLGGMLRIVRFDQHDFQNSEYQEGTDDQLSDRIGYIGMPHGMINSYS